MRKINDGLTHNQRLEKRQPGYFAAAQKRYRLRHPERYKARYMKAHAKRRVRLPIRFSLADYDAMVASQDGRCAICRKPPNPDGNHTQRRLVVDHDHSLANHHEALRGLLCWNCNVMLGHARDSVATLKAAIEYLGG